MLTLCIHIVALFVPSDLFFQLEREYILQTMPSNDEQDVKKVDTRRVGEDIDEEMPSRYRLIRFNEDWHKSASGKRSKDKNAPKRKHRKSHGKIGFLELSSVISKRWHQLNVLDAETKTYVTKIAKQLLEEYKREMATFKAQSAAASSGINNSAFSSFPGMPSLPLSFQPYQKITYPPPPSFHGGHAHHSSPSKTPRVTFDASSYAADSVDGDQLLQEGPLSFTAKSSGGNQLPSQGPALFAAGVVGDKLSKESSAASEKEQGNEDVMVGEDNQMPSKFTFFPVTSRAYTKRKSMEDDIDVRERRQHRHHNSSSNKKRKYLTRKDIESEKSKLKRKIRAMRDQMRRNEEMNCLNREGGCDEIQYDYDSVRSMIENEIDSFMARHFEPGARSRERRQSSSSSSSSRKKSEHWEETPSRSRSQMNYYSASSYTPCHYELEGRYSSSRQKKQREWKTPSPSGSETESDYCDPAPCPISPEHELKMSSGDAEDLMKMLGTAEWCNN